MIANMKKAIFKFTVTRDLSLALIVLLSWSITGAADNGCDAAVDYAFVCGPKYAEALVLVPGIQCTISIGMA